MPFKVKDESLAKQGALNIEWAESQMGSLLEIRKRFEKEKPLKGLTIGMALHVTKETAALVRTLETGGAKVYITGCNPLMLLLHLQKQAQMFLLTRGKASRNIMSS